MTEQQDAPFAGEDPDVEGHKLRHANALGSKEGDDVEGHRFKPSNAVQPQYDEDDVEGHRKL